jgi:hypothetical protein
MTKEILQAANRDSCTFTYYYRIPAPEGRKQSHQACGFYVEVILDYMYLYVPVISNHYISEIHTKAEESVLLQYDDA